MKAFLNLFQFLWPGSTGAVRYGLWSHFFIAFLFGGICQVSLFISFYWVNFLSTFGRLCVGIGVFLAWLSLSAVAYKSIKKYKEMLNEDSDGEMFLEAQTHYLRGRWFETECCLKGILKKNPFDVESLLLMATLCRHLKRFVEARRFLMELEKIESSRYWTEEILLEKQMIVEDEADNSLVEKNGPG